MSGRAARVPPGLQQEVEMKKGPWIAGMVAVALTSYALGAETRKSFVDTYSAIADTILGSKKAESGIVKAILQSHHGSAGRWFADGKFDLAAAEMALFANEGDNQVGGIRKRLLEGGHHHNAEGEAKGIYDEGFVIVTKAAKKACLDAASAMQTAGDDAARKAAWEAFDRAAAPLVK
jgi:hypothetical protein